MLKEVKLYRALAVGETALVCAPLPADLLSACCSRVIASSGRTAPSLKCFTEDPRIALKYCKQPGYSGDIAIVVVTIGEDGTCRIVDYDKKQFIHRMWMTEDYIDLFEEKNLHSINNFNSNTSWKATNIVSYTRNSPHGYTHRLRTWLIHTSTPYHYSRLLNEQEKVTIQRLKSFTVPSLKLLTYNSKNVFAVNHFLEAYSELDADTQTKAWYRYTVADLEALKTKYIA